MLELLLCLLVVCLLKPETVQCIAGTKIIDGVVIGNRSCRNLMQVWLVFAFLLLILIRQVLDQAYSWCRNGMLLFASPSTAPACVEEQCLVQLSPHFLAQLHCSDCLLRGLMFWFFAIVVFPRVAISRSWGGRDFRWMNIVDGICKTMSCLPSMDFLSLSIPFLVPTNSLKVVPEPHCFDLLN